MTYFLRTIDNASHREDLLARFARLDPTQPPLWGRLTAPSMLVHLCDQMRMPFNDNPSGPMAGPPRIPVVRELFLYVVPWPKGVVQGPPEAFQSDPGDWADDLESLKELVDQFVSVPSDRHLADHPNWGPLNRRQWGFFCYRHFNHHLRQFGV